MLDQLDDRLVKSVAARRAGLCVGTQRGPWGHTGHGEGADGSIAQWRRDRRIYGFSQKTDVTTHPVRGLMMLGIEGARD